MSALPEGRHGRPIDLETWPRTGRFRLFKSYARPHFATTARLDVTGLLTRLKPRGVSPYRACLFAIGTGLNGIEAFRTRFAGDRVVEFDSIALSMTVPRPDDSFGYAYVPFDSEWESFDAHCKAVIDATAHGADLGANTGQRLDLAYLSCLPWVDFTAFDNALSSAEDCIPRFSWGKFVEAPDGRWSCALSVQVHHALIDGLHVGQVFAATQTALDGLAARLG